MGAVGWRDRLLETAPVPNRFLPSSDLCYKKLERRGEEEEEKEAAAAAAAYSHTCDPRVYMRRRRWPPLRLGNRSIDTGQPDQSPRILRYFSDY